MCVQYQHCYQGTHSVGAYAKEYYRLSARNNLRESKNQLVGRYMGGLNLAIRDKLEMSSLLSLSHTVNLAQKVEILILRGLKTIV